MDPYRIRLPDNEAALLIVGNAFEERLIGKWTTVKASTPGFFHLELYKNDANDLRLDYVRTKKHKAYISLVMSSDYRDIRLHQDITGTGGMMAFAMLGHIIPYALFKHSFLTLHGALLEHEGRGIIVSAPSGIGKTTHARLWRDHRRALILNGDRATCCMEDGQWIGFSLPWSGTSGECINRDVPLTAFVALEQSTENRVERLYGLDAFEAVMPNLIYPSWDKELTEKALDYIDSFLEKIPVFRLSCRPDLEAVETLEKALSEL